MEINDRVKINTKVEYIGDDGLPINIPEGHEGTIIETYSMPAGQVWWTQLTVRLDPINGRSYVLKDSPIWFKPVIAKPTEPATS